MRLLSVLSALGMLAFTMLALLKLSEVAHFRLDVAMCIWAFASALGLGAALYARHLRDRIAVLESRLAERE